MASFVESCRCSGARPAGIVGHRFTSRPDIVGRLLRDRHVVRFVVAPTGFGKSTTVFEYSNIIFGFRDMLWMNCKSPCFLRDLDANVLLSAIRHIEPALRLAVFEDVPCLDDDRAIAFSNVLDQLLSLDYEVIVTCTPSADTFSHLQRDRMMLTGNDLLLSDDELVTLAVSNRYSEQDISAIPSISRIAGMYWRDEGARALLQGVSLEELPQDVVLTMIVLLVLGSGNIDDIQAFLTPDRAREAGAIISESYPFFGLDSRAGVYKTVDVSIAQIAENFGARMSRFAACSTFGDKDALACRLADMLIESEQYRRACEFMCSFASKSAAAGWLVRSCRCLIRNGEAYAIAKLHDAIRRGATGQLDALSICKSWASLMMGDTDAVLTFSKRISRSGAASVMQKMQVFCFLILFGDKQSVKKAAFKLSQILDQFDESAAKCEESLYCDTLVMAKFALAIEDGGLVAVKDWDLMRTQDSQNAAKLDVLLFCAGILMKCIVAELSKDDSSSINGFKDGSIQSDLLNRLRTMLAFCKNSVEAHVSSNNWFIFFAAQNILDITDALPLFSDLALSDKAVSNFQRMRASISKQCEEYGLDVRRAKAKQHEYNVTNPSIFRFEEDISKNENASTSIPTLSVNLFGGMEVRLGGRILEPNKLSRMKTKTLLAVLVINRGKEIPRHRLAEILWPDSGIDSYRRNFYSIWSQLKQSLSIDGTCPYLIRSQVGCSIDMRLVTSDVYEYDKICRALLFGSDEANDWEYLYSRVCNEYAGKLMPCETENKTIVSLRDHYHAQMVDGLIATSARLVAMNEPRGALWFAREAARRESKREDVFIALMEAQIAADQRSAALETYFECRQFLSEELGIDPSSRLVGLYRSIIETEDVF
ncbi:BTAD domain-containing putative transcriptional regulator [Adlercreutzia sp. ZJ154]|uniref:AfsR/SARP family transcriptional regulator n=1 Tax=Adlercreutzia sp. ZJ154 TaxID=2709790 RepID=UPI0013EA2AE1|nr:BTAD domain-containing putative transcriptional regulator [Adlercreutzia sp. ZJ154]